VDCTTIYPFTDVELNGFQGILSAAAVTDVKAAVSACPVLLRHFKTLILK
jgi:hypothetical protein